MQEYQVSIAATETDGKGNPVREPETETYWVIGDNEVEAIRAVVNIIDAKQWEVKRNA